MIFLIAIAVILIPVLLGLGFAVVTARMDKAVTETTKEVELQERAYNPALTLGHEIEVNASPDEQVKQARLLAAQQAAAMPRGANSRIGRKGNSLLKTAWQGVNQDPLTAAKIAQFHGWQGVKTGAVATPVAQASAPAAVAKGGKIKLVPGKDYPVIEITDDMSPADKRKARIANSKAKSAAVKAAKASGAPAAAQAAAPATAAAPAAPAPAAPAVNIDPPQLIEITDDMPPEEKRKARIANSKAKSAYNKALKAAGVDPNAAAAQSEAPAPAAAAAPQPAASAPTAANLPPKPELVDITDDMPADEKRKARIANSKAKSAYNKALKAAGIDPKTVEW